MVAPDARSVVMIAATAGLVEMRVVCFAAFGQIYSYDVQ